MKKALKLMALFAAIASAVAGIVLIVIYLENILTFLKCKFGKKTVIVED